MRLRSLRTWYHRSLAIVGLVCCSSVASAQTILEQLDAAPDEATLISLHQKLEVPRSDLDGDGWVGFADYIVISRNYGQANVGYSGGDVNIDAVVGLEDFAILSRNFGVEGYQPEPPSVAPQANFGLSLNADDAIVVSTSSPVEIGGLELVSPSGSLLVPEDLQFRDTVRMLLFDLASNNERFAVGALPGLATELNGDLTTPIRSTSENVSIRWFEPGSYDIHTRAFGEGDDLTGVPYVQPEPDGSEPTPRPVPIPSGSELDFSQLNERFTTVTNEADLIQAHADLNVPRGNVDGDWGVNLGDLFYVGSQIGKPGNGYTSGDVNLDGEIDLADMAIIQTNFGAARFTIEPDVRAIGNLGLSLDANDNVVISTSDPVEVGGLEISSSDASLFTPTATDANFPFVYELVNDADRVAWLAGPRSSVLLDGDLTTRTTSSSENLTVSWFERGSYDVRSLDFGEGDPVNGQSSPPEDNDPPVRYPIQYSQPTSFEGPEFEITTNPDNSIDQVTDAFNLIDNEADLISQQIAMDLPRGDMDGNGKVDMNDYFLFEAGRRFVSIGRGFAGGDFNLDGEVADFRDLAILVTQFGQEGYSEDGEVERVQLNAAFDESGRVVIASEGPVEVVGIELNAPGATFTVDSETPNLPFMVMSQTAEDSVIWNNVGSHVLLDGELVTSVLSDDTNAELGLRWFQAGSFEVFGSLPDPSVTSVSETIAGDLNGDGRVNFPDFLILSRNYGTEGSLETGDIDGDGAVQFPDFLILSNNYGKSFAAASVPEPTTNLLVALVGLSLFTLRPRRVRN